ncbi:hypothetical protein [Phycisphaera mikurensis]|uniref:Uncharacterized protein n=1 Tax=Phycisphaera mikurensis (strain NBRC 102666 / KCTC 22515 / FYK2301M01) TaxID=1142394 RepID=I0IGE0_PHYMF|nr:hypothetical protein [Phycisphaera mikurensis]MBB6440294.1 uncharacterized protein YigA (DUF484 family) [Phycisphaera mikurensis]BAM04328.1 hypothetical protein PSMK_21690 [Phycisphaera mikurensis NBRC 102666]
MRTLAAVIVLMVAVHLLAATAGGVWLAASGRLSGERVREAIDLFKPTVAEAARAAEAEATLEAETLATQRDLTYLASVSDGPQPLEERLAERLSGEQLVLHRLERMREEGDAIGERMAQDRAWVDERLEEIRAREQAVAALLEAERAQRDDADFQRAVATFTALPAKQAKGVAQRLLEEGKAEEVVSWLAAMPLRNRAAVLKAFKSPAEVAVAADLVEALRNAGTDRLSEAVAAAPAAPAAAPPPLPGG